MNDEGQGVGADVPLRPVADPRRGEDPACCIRRHAEPAVTEPQMRPLSRP